MNSNTNVFAKVFCRPADGIDVGGLSERQKCRLRRPGKPDGIIFEYLQNLADQMSRLFCFYYLLYSFRYSPDSLLAT